MLRSAIARATCATVVAASIGTAGGDSQAVEQIQRYCDASWQRAGVAQQDWSECTQEVFTEMLRRVSRKHLATAIEDAESDERRELKRSVWCVIQRWRRAPKSHSLKTDDLREHLPVSNGNNPLDDLADQLNSAIEQLNERQKTIVRLWSEGLSIAKIARHMGLTAPRVSDEKYKAIAKLRGYMTSSYA